MEQEQGQIPHLTQGEHDVIKLLSQGLTNGAIAERLHLSPLTVRNCVSQLLSKFQVRNRTALLARVMELQRRYHRRIIQ